MLKAKSELLVHQKLVQLENNAPNIWKASQETVDQTFGIQQEFPLQ
jgi:hypothetical protein